MDGVSNISSVNGGGQQIWPTQNLPVGGAQPGEGQTNIAGLHAGSSDSIMAVNSMSMSATSESFLSTFGGAISSNEMLGALLLLILVEYMKSEDEEEKKSLLNLMTALIAQQNAQNNGGLLMHSSSMTMESTQITASSSHAFTGAYGGEVINTQQAPPTDASAGGLNVVA